MAAGWNKGLTKYSDERVANYGKSVSKFFENKRLNQLPILEKRVCPKCGKEFEINLRISNRKYCSKSCANGHKHSEETKQKISQSIDKYNKENLKGKYKPKHIITKENKHKINKRNYCTICGSEKGKCPRLDICKHHQILKSLEKFTLDISTKGSLDIISEFDRVKEILQNIYNSHPSDNDLVNNWNYKSGLANFHKLIKSVGIKTRTLSEAQNEAILMGKHVLPNSYMFKHCWHTTWENKKVYLRSSYELDYAKYLDENKIVYDVEKLRIKYFDTQRNLERIAIPDFYLTETNTIVEIKSGWTLDKQNMIDKFKSYFELGYNCKLILNKQEVDLYSL